MSYAPLPEHQSIFGDTYHGVPNPLVAHCHPYPTRFHGPIYSYPWFDMPYQAQTWVGAYGPLDGNDGVPDSVSASMNPKMTATAFIGLGVAAIAAAALLSKRKAVR